MSGTDVAHPLIAPVPRLARPGRALARRLVLGALARAWQGSGTGRLDVRLPDGARVRLGAAGAPDATITVADERAFVRVALRGELGAGEAFVAGEWTADDLPAALRLFLRATAARGLESWLTRLAVTAARRRHRRAANDRAGSARNVGAHYDLGNAFYRLFLDDQLIYSCALWPPGARDLEAAQVVKLDRLCDLAAIGPGARVLELGCGWGALAIHAARRGARVTAVTVSPAQLAEARARVAAAGVADRVDVALCDYRDTTGRYDAILSCEMLEAVGAEFLPGFFATVAARLQPGGRAAIQSITMPDARYAAYRRSVDWMQTYVFPGTHIPSLGAIDAALAGTGLTRVAADDIGPDYAPTLRAWRERFTAALPAVRRLGFDEPFVRTWTLYLAFSEAAFAERTLTNHQLILRRT
ncbi:MAG TPA: cyclopropane-fatty-acyl-phospholipid synthase family protein [Kofleriaceae bacterium]|nr:cyclopropane-fatty-acyl-phospholipid synthase family protein [Kofleriaceae bacterium]